MIKITFNLFHFDISDLHFVNVAVFHKSITQAEVGEVLGFTTPPLLNNLLGKFDRKSHKSEHWNYKSSITDPKKSLRAHACTSVREVRKYNRTSLKE